jgi:hypothetical protein
MNEARDDDLRARFGALGAEEAARAPEFRSVLERVPARRRSATSSRSVMLLGLAAAAVLAVATGVAIRGRRTGEPLTLVADSTPSRAPAEPSITTWTSPTAGLLRTSGSMLLSAPPPIHSSILDGAFPTPAEPKGDSQ